jgi:hypothetical protein
MYGMQSSQVVDKIDLEPISIKSTTSCQYNINADTIIRKLDPRLLEKTALYSVKLKDQAGKEIMFSQISFYLVFSNVTFDA